MSEINGNQPVEQQGYQVDYRLVVQHMEQRYMQQIAGLIQENAQLAAVQESIINDLNEARSTIEQLQAQRTKIVSGNFGPGQARPRPIKDNPQG